MKTIRALFVLFFAFTVSALAKANVGYDYGLPDLVEISGAESSDDGDWIRYGGSLYHNINIPILRGETIRFGKGLPVVGAKSSADAEFVYWGRNNYQKFRPGADWAPTPSKLVKPDERSWPMLIAFVGGMIWFLKSFAGYTNPSRRRSL